MTYFSNPTLNHFATVQNLANLRKDRDQVNILKAILATLKA